MAASRWLFAFESEASIGFGIIFFLSNRYILITGSLYLMRPKVVSLCDETWALAMEKDNFSEWVRSQLLAADEKRIEVDAKAIAIWKKTGEWPEWYQ